MRTQGHVPTNRQLVDIGDGHKVPSEITAIAEDVDGYTVTLTAVYRPASGRYEAREMTVRSENGQEVSGEALRSVPVATILRDGIMSALQAATALTFGPPPSDLGKRPTQEALEWVARIYRLALLVGEAPTQAVAGALDLPRSTAGRWVMRARDRGLLTVQDPRGGKLE